MKNCDYSTSEFGRRCKVKSAKATKTARVKYNEREQDVLYLCQGCAELLEQEAQKHDWKLTVRDYACLPSKNST